jgi:hypothetical protein
MVHCVGDGHGRCASAATADCGVVEADGVSGVKALGTVMQIGCNSIVLAFNPIFLAKEVFS